MTITFKQKMDIINHLADPANWDNIFDAEWVAQRKRNIKTEYLGDGIRREKDPNAALNRYFFEFRKPHPDNEDKLISYQAAVTLKKQGAALFAEDENGVAFKISSTGITILSDKGPGKIQAMSASSEDERFIEDDMMACLIDFDEEGGKTLLFPNLGRRITMSPPEEPYDGTLRQSQKTHVVAFNLAAWSDIAYTDFVNGLKLIVARDLGMEPRLGAVNELDKNKVIDHLSRNAPDLPDINDLRDKFGKFHENRLDLLLSPLSDAYDKAIRDLLGDNSGLTADDLTKLIMNSSDEKSLEDEITQYINDNLKKSSLRRAWHDSTEFAGSWTASPRLFLFAASKDGFTVSTDVDGRNHIWTQGAILEQATQGNHDDYTGAEARLPGQLIEALTKGQTLTDNTGQGWLYTRLKHEEAGALAREARKINRENFGLEGPEFMAIAHEKNSLIIAMRKEKFHHTAPRYKASLKLEHAILAGQNTKDNTIEALKQGADLRYVHPKAAARGKTFESLMRAREDFAGLSVLRNEGKLIFDGNNNLQSRYRPGS